MTLVQPTPAMSLRIQKDLNEEPEKNLESVLHIKEWLEKQPHLPHIDDDARLLTFLRGCKFSLEKTKRKLDMYYSMRSALPEFFSHRDPTLPEIQQVFKDIQLPPLPGLTPEGRRVVVMRANGSDIGNIIEGFKVVLMIGDVRLKEEQVGVAGDVYILDATIATPSQFSKFTPLLVKKFLVCVQEAYPVKLKEIHVVNVSPLVDSIISFVKPFLKEKIRDRIHIHSDGLQSLYKYVPKEMLPEEYGGDAGSIKNINDDQHLVAFLRGCKFSLERTKEKLDAYYTLRTHLKEIFLDRDPMSPEIQEVIKSGIFLPLRDPDDEGRRVFLMKPGNADPLKIKMITIFKLNMMIADISLLEDDVLTIAGSVSLCDMRGMTLGHVTQMTPTLMKQSMICFQEGYPIRPKGIHYIYSPQFFESAFNLLKSLAKEKLRKRIFIHGDNMEEVFKVIPQRILPKEYGGDGGTTEELIMELKSRIESYRDWFLEDKNYGVDESKRPGKPKTHEDLFGMEGSFRQLTVD